MLERFLGVSELWGAGGGGAVGCPNTCPHVFNYWFQLAMEVDSQVLEGFHPLQKVALSTAIYAERIHVCDGSLGGFARLLLLIDAVTIVVGFKLLPRFRPCWWFPFIWL